MNTSAAEKRRNLLKAETEQAPKCQEPIEARQSSAEETSGAATRPAVAGVSAGTAGATGDCKGKADRRGGAHQPRHVS